MMPGTSSRQAEARTAERQQQLPPHLRAAELSSVAEAEKQRFSLFPELPVEGSLGALGKSPFTEGKMCTSGTCQHGHFAAFLPLPC